jgi:hypothetical protein
LAITRIGSVGTFVDGAANSGSTSITVPDTCTLLIVSISGCPPSNPYMAPPTYNGTTMDVGKEVYGDTNGAGVGIYYLRNPTIGSYTLAWNHTGSSTFADGGDITYAFYKGEDATQPRDSDGNHVTETTSSSSLSTPTMTAVTGDMIFSAFYVWDTNLPTGAPTWTNATHLAGETYNGSYHAVAETFPTGNVAVTANPNGNTGDKLWMGLASCVFRAASANAASVSDNVNVSDSLATSQTGKPVDVAYIRDYVVGLLTKLKASISDTTYTRESLATYKTIATTAEVILIHPTAMTDTMLTSSNLTETDADEWSAGTGYSAGNQVMVTAYSDTATVGAPEINSHRACTTNGNAFFWALGQDFTYVQGSDTGDAQYYITLTDYAGKHAYGYIAGGGASSVATESVIMNGFMTTGVYEYDATWMIFGPPSGATSTNGTTFELAHFAQTYQYLKNGSLYKTLFNLSARTSGTLYVYYGSGNRSWGYTTTGNKSEYWNSNETTTYTRTEWGFDGNGSFNGSIVAGGAYPIYLTEVTDCPNAANGGLHIVSSRNGTTRNFESVDSGFNPSRIATYLITSDATPLHQIYEAIASTTGDYPPISSTKWLYLGKTNKWKCFDSVVQDQATNTTQIQFVITPGSLDSITNGGSPVYSETIFCDGLTKAIRTDLPSGYTAGVLTININKEGTAKCGEIVFGLQYSLGTLRPLPTIGITDYSIKEADDFGNYTITERAYGSRADLDIKVDSDQIDTVYGVLADVRATPSVYVAYNGYVSTIFYGFYKDFTLTLSNPEWADLTISIEGLT